MQIIKHAIEGVIEIIPAIFNDERGFFLETFHNKKMQEALSNIEFVQDNQSFSYKGVLRGLHFQEGEYAQGKLVRVVSGKALDVFVDMRKDSPTFGKYGKVILEATKQNMLYIPEGFAHGFCALEDTIFCYRCTNYYNKASENGIVWNDAMLNIDWGMGDFIVSEKDRVLPTWKEYFLNR